MHTWRTCPTCHAPEAILVTLAAERVADYWPCVRCGRAVTAEDIADIERQVTEGKVAA